MNKIRPFSIHEVRPRQHAFKILEMEDKEERRRYMAEDVPDHLKDWVRHYVVLWWPRRRQLVDNN